MGSIKLLQLFEEAVAHLVDCPAMTTNNQSKYRFVLLLGIVFLLSSVSLSAQGPQESQGGEGKPVETTDTRPAKKAEIPEEFESPHRAMGTFVEAMSVTGDESFGEVERENARTTAISCLDLSQANSERAWTLATKLVAVIHRLGTYEPWYLWWKGEAEASQSTEQIYFPHRRFDRILADYPSVTPKGRILLRKQADGRWLFSAETMAGVDELFLSMESLPVLADVDEEQLETGLGFRRHLPESLKGETLLSLEYWQWLGLLLVIFAGVVVDLSLRWVLRVITRFIISRQDARARKQTITRVVRPAGLVAAAVLWQLLLPFLDLGDRAYTIVFAAARVFSALAGTWAAFRFADLVGEIFASKATRSETKFDDVLVPLVRKTIKVFIMAAGFIYCAVALRINILPMLTGLGIGGLAFAFAAKDTIENFFGSIAVIVDRSFEVGDWVVISDVEGTVENVGFRSTRIRTFYNSLVTIPNANLVRANVNNYGRRKYRRWKTSLGVQYDTAPEKIIAFTEGIRELVRSHPYTRKDYFQVRFHQFSGSSLDVLVYVFHEVPDWSTELRERERLALDILRLADQLGVKFAFPTQTLHLHREELDPDHVPSEIPKSMTERRSLVRGIRAAQGLTRNQGWLKEKPGPVQYQGGPSVIAPEDVADPDAHKVTEVPAVDPPSDEGPRS